MIIEKIRIENFKSIKEMEFDIKKYGNSYTTMLVGINESGKSNILEAMSFLNTPDDDFRFSDYCNQKKIKSSSLVNIQFDLKFEYKLEYLKPIQEKIGETGELLDFEIDKICKTISLSKEADKFSDQYEFEIKKFPKNLFIQIMTIVKNNKKEPSYEISREQDEANIFEELTEELFKKYFKNDIIEIIKKSEPSVTLWKPNDEYLISKENLNKFAENIHSNKALRNIFLLADYDNKERIKTAINDISDSTQRSRLASELNEELNKYLKKVWKHHIDVVIEITETGQLDIFIRDTGRENMHDRFSIKNRSEGAKHFLSLILSLSIETKKKKRKNQLILIDEPEAHLHPSGIRDLGNELLEMGEENFVFIATHSPFLIDKIRKERNIIIKKNNDAITEKREIKDYENFIDDEVLREAFGIEVYKDLLNPHSILVEGASDKIILQKTLQKKGEKKYGITNGHGSNIDTLAAKLNDSGISILVVLDDDAYGKYYKKKIMKIEGSYSDANVFTIRDLNGDIINNGTIEDTLGKKFIESQFKIFYNSKFEKDCSLELEEDSPFIEQIKKFLQNDKHFSNKISECYQKCFNELETKSEKKNSKITLKK